MVRSVISLGGNVGDVPGAFASAVELLNQSGNVTALEFSPIYRTLPMGSAAGAVFHNAAAVFETTLNPLELLDLLQQTEGDCGRIRTVRWGPRTLDLDLLMYGDEVLTSPRLSVPHPTMWYRRFVLDPLAELMPNAVHPVFQSTINELRARLLLRPLPIGFTAGALWIESTSPATVVVDKAHLGQAAIVFAGSDEEPAWPRAVCVPEQETLARQAVRDVLTAALDEPIRIS